MPAGDISVTMGKCKNLQWEKYFKKDSIKRVGGEYHPQELEILMMKYSLHCITVLSQKRKSWEPETCFIFVHLLISFHLLMICDLCYIWICSACPQGEALKRKRRDCKDWEVAKLLESRHWACSAVQKQWGEVSQPWCQRGVVKAEVIVAWSHLSRFPAAVCCTRE